MYERKDSYYRRAKAAGLRSRAAFKLEELAREIIRPGNRVLELGCWPGGWLQVASRLVGKQGLVVGVDLMKLDPLGLLNVRAVQGDVSRPETMAVLREALGGSADVVLSDLSPKLAGIRDRDEARASDLVHLALELARHLLKPGGGFVCKIFMSAGHLAFMNDVKRSFDQVWATRPSASRKGSAELYVVARGFRRA